MSDALELIGGSLAPPRKRAAALRTSGRSKRYIDDEIELPERPGPPPNQQDNPGPSKRQFGDFVRINRDINLPKVIDLPPAARLATQPGSESNISDEESIVFRTADEKIQPPEPLLDPKRERNILRELCSVDKPSHEIDQRLLVEALTRAEPCPSRLPLCARRRPARTIHIAPDVRARMAVFYSDTTRVFDILQRYTNSSVIWNPWLMLGEVVRPRSLADAEDGDEADKVGPAPQKHRLSDDHVVLILSDLGYGKLEPTKEQLRVSQQSIMSVTSVVARSGAELAALIPVSPQLWPSQRATLGSIYWNRITTPAHARSVRRGSRTRFPFAAPADRVQAGGIRLARACIFAPRATPRLLRALRTALFPGSGPEWEAETWSGPYMVPSSPGFALIDHALLGEQAQSVVSWTRMIRDLRRHGWTKYVQAVVLAERPLASEVDLGDHQATRPVDWAAARFALGEMLRSDSALLDFLTTGERSSWADELVALAEGLGCVFSEQAYEITKAASANHPVERFEEQLLWSAYEDTLAEDGRNQVRKLFHNLIDAMTNPLRLDEHEMVVEWASTRLSQMPTWIQKSEGWKSAVVALAEVAGRETSSDELRAIWGLVLEGEGFERYRRAPRQDVYAYWRPWSGWLLTLNRLPGNRETPCRFRAPKGQAVLLYVLDGLSGTGHPLTLIPGETAMASTAQVLELVTLAGDRFRIIPETDIAALSFVDLVRHQKHDREVGDWLAAGRWASQALAKSLGLRQRLITTLRVVEGASITEDDELIQTALNALPELATGEDKSELGLLAILTSRLALARILEIDSRLGEAISLCEEAVEIVNDNGFRSRYKTASSLQILLNSFIIDMGIRNLALKRVRSAVDALEQMTLRSAFGSGLGRFWESAPATSLHTLARYYRVAGDISGLRRVIERAKDTASKTADSEINYTIDRINEIYNSYFMSAADSIKIQEKLLKHSMCRSRTDQLIAMAESYARTQFNTGRPELARLLTLNILEITNQRRSRWRIALYLEELAYQLSRQGRPSDAARLFSSAKNIIPKEEEEFRHQLTTDEGLPLASGDLDKNNEAIQPYRRMLQTAAEQGNRWREMLMLEKMMASGYSSIFDKDEAAAGTTARAYSLGRLYQDTLGGVNMFWEIGKRSLMSSEPDGPTNFELLERAVETARRLDVPDSVILILIDISKIHAQGSIDGRTPTQSIDPVAALAAAERAVEFADADEKRSDAKASAAYCQRGDVRRLRGDLSKAEQDARCSLRLAKGGNHVLATIGACNLFANIEFDRRKWAAVLDWFEQAMRELSTHLPYYKDYGQIDHSRLNDLMEERTLNNLKIDDQTSRGSFVANMPRAARLFRDYLILTGQHAGATSLPLNDFWYWGEALKKSNIPEAAWYYRAAVYRDLYEGKPRKDNNDRMNILVDMWLDRAKKFSTEAGNREDLEFDPFETFDHLQKRYQK